MKRLIVLLVAAVLIAAAPASQGDHTVELSPDRPTAFVDGNGTAAAGTVNQCGKDVDDYCEIVHVAVTNPVEDTDPSVVESREFQLDIDVTAEVPGSDFDLYVYASNADGNKTSGNPIAMSENWPLCAQLCSTPASVLYDGHVDSLRICDGVDDCVSITGTTRDDAETAYYLVEISYYLTVSGFDANFAYAGL